MLGIAVSGLLETAEGVTVALTNPTLPPPVVFSGTNCFCAGEVVADPGCYVTSAALSIGSATVAAYTWQQGQPRYRRAVLACSFASTRFNPGPLSLIIQGSDSSGDSKSSHRHEVPEAQRDRVYNFSRVYVLQEFENVYAHAYRIHHALSKPYTGMNHTGVLNIDSWPKPFVLEHIPEGTAFHVSTHGGMAGNSYIEDSAKLRIFSNEIGQRVDQKANHTPWPYPPYNIVLVNACESAPGHDMALIGFRILDYVGNPPPAESRDRAFVGWEAPVPVDKGTQFAPAFWEALNEGKTVQEACNAGYQAAGWDPKKPSVEVEIIGDDHATLDPNRVYTGDQTPAPNGWYISSVDLQEPLP